MNTSNRKLLGTALILAAVALFAWTAYEPANLMSALHLGSVASEAAVVVVALAISGWAFAGGCALLFARFGFPVAAKKV